MSVAGILVDVRVYLTGFEHAVHQMEYALLVNGVLHKFVGHALEGEKRFVICLLYVYCAMAAPYVAPNPWENTDEESVTEYLCATDDQILQECALQNRQTCLLVEFVERGFCQFFIQEME